MPTATPTTKSLKPLLISPSFHSHPRTALSPIQTPGDRLLGWRKNIRNSLVFEGAGIGGAVGRMTDNGKNCPQAAGQGQAENQVTASDVVASSTSAKRVSCERKAAVDAATASRRCGDGGRKGGRQRGRRRHGGEPARQGVEGEDCGGALTLSPSLLLPCLLCASARAGADEITRRGGRRSGEKRARDGRMDCRQLSLALLSPANSLSPYFLKAKLPRHGKLASMPWKNGKTCFQGLELFPKHASKAWKNSENGFQGLENPA